MENYSNSLQNSYDTKPTAWISQQNSVADPGCLSWILIFPSRNPDPRSGIFSDPDPEVKKALDPDTATKYQLPYC